MLKLETIQKVIEKNNLKFYNMSVICGTAIFSKTFFDLGIGEILSCDKNHIIHFGDKGISILVVDQLTGSLRKDDNKGYAFIDNLEVINISANFKLTKVVILIETRKGVLTYNVTRSVYFAPWHAQNLSAILLKANLKK